MCLRKICIKVQSSGIFVWLGNRNRTREQRRKRRIPFHSVPDYRKLLKPKLILASICCLRCVPYTTGSDARLFFFGYGIFLFWECCTFLKKKKRRKATKKIFNTNIQRNYSKKKYEEYFFTNLEHKKTTEKKPKCFTTTPLLYITDIFYFSFRTQSYKNHNGIYQTDTNIGSEYFGAAALTLQHIFVR